jgi:hypothetical protein
MVQDVRQQLKDAADAKANASSATDRVAAQRTANAVKAKADQLKVLADSLGDADKKTVAAELADMADKVLKSASTDQLQSIKQDIVKNEEKAASGSLDGLDYAILLGTPVAAALLGALLGGRRGAPIGLALGLLLGGGGGIGIEYARGKKVF